MATAACTAVAAAATVTTPATPATPAMPATATAAPQAQPPFVLGWRKIGEALGRGTYGSVSHVHLWVHAPPPPPSPLPPQPPLQLVMPQLIDPHATAVTTAACTAATTLARADDVSLGDTLRAGFRDAALKTLASVRHKPRRAAQEDGGGDKPAKAAAAVVATGALANRGETLCTDILRELIPHVLLPAHPHLCLADAILLRDRAVHVVLPLMHGGTLERALRSDALVPLKLLRAWTVQLGAALAHMHAYGMWHRDIKTANVLLDARGHAYLADLGMSRIAPRDATVHATRDVCTLWTRAWELLKGAYEPADGGGRTLVYTNRIDCWSLGVVLLCIAAGRHVLCPRTDADAVTLIRTHVFAPGGVRALLAARRTDLPPEFFELVEALLAREAGDRLAASAVAAHAFCAGWDLATAAATVERLYPKWCAAKTARAAATAAAAAAHAPADATANVRPAVAGTKRRRSASGAAPSAATTARSTPHVILNADNTLWMRAWDAAPRVLPPRLGAAAVPAAIAPIRAWCGLWGLVQQGSLPLDALFDTLQLFGTAHAGGQARVWHADNARALVAAAASLINKAHAFHGVRTAVLLSAVGACTGATRVTPTALYALEVDVFAAARGAVIARKPLRWADAAAHTRGRALAAILFVLLCNPAYWVLRGPAGPARAMAAADAFVAALDAAGSEGCSGAAGEGGDVDVEDAGAADARTRDAVARALARACDAEEDAVWLWEQLHALAHMYARLTPPLALDERTIWRMLPSPTTAASDTPAASHTHTWLDTTPAFQTLLRLAAGAPSLPC